jgi:5-methylcytosine-specific restriction enzyme A
VAFKDITYGAVIEAVNEYDRLGQDEFLREYGFHPAREYVLVHSGKSYDSKAIVGVAHGYLPGQKPLASTEFSGGEATVGRLVPAGQGACALPAHLLALGLRTSTSRRSADGPWPETREQVSSLLSRYGRGTEGDRVYYPVAALHRAGLWELDANPEQVPSAHGSTIPQRWFENHRPQGGLVEAAYDLVRESPEALS